MRPWRSTGNRRHGKMIADADAELVARIARGDREAAAALVDRHLAHLLALARRMLGDATEAEDVTQEVFLRAWRQAPRWRPGVAKFETWMHRVTLNLCYDRLRRRPMPVLDAIDLPDAGPDPETRLNGVQIGAAIEAALLLLPERQRAAILLCHQDGLGNIEAAEILGVTVEALESLLSRGRRALRAHLAHLKEDHA